MDDIKSCDIDQITIKIIQFIAHELKLLPEKILPDLVINKGVYRLDSKQIHMILACIADDTGISMITLRDSFPYGRYFLTCKSGVFLVLGVMIFIIGMIISLIERSHGLFIFVFSLALLIEAIALIKYIETRLVRNINPALTIKLFTEIAIAIINKHRDDTTFDITPQERQMWRHKIYEVFTRYLHIFSTNEFSPGLMVPLSDPDELDMPLVVEECGEIFSLSFEEIDQSGIYEKYIDYDEDDLLTVVHFADILIDFWTQHKKKAQNIVVSNIRLKMSDKIGYSE